MKKIGFFFSLLLFLYMVACTSGTKSADNDNSANGKAAPISQEALDHMKKNDVKAYNRTKYDKIVTGLQHPESVATDGKFFYVSNIGAHMTPARKDGDGFISKLDAEGNILELKWISGEDLHAPKGMAIVKGMLYVTDIDKIRGYDMKTQKKVFQLDFTSVGGTYLNDLAIRDDQTLYVSLTELGAIYKVDLRGKGSFEMVDIYSDLAGADGLYYDRDRDRLIIVSFGYDVSPTGMVGVCPMNVTPLKKKSIGIYHGFLDGVQQVADDMILLTDWQDMEKGGNLVFYDLVTEDVFPVLGGLIGGPADFYYDAKTKKVWLPAMKDNELIITTINVNLVRKDQGQLINSSGGYEVRIVDTVELSNEIPKE